MLRKIIKLNVICASVLGHTYVNASAGVEPCDYVPYTGPGMVITSGRPISLEDGAMTTDQKEALSDSERLRPDKFFPKSLWVSDGEHRVILRRSFNALSHSSSNVTDGSPLTLTSLNARLKENAAGALYKGKELTIQNGTTYLGEEELRKAHPSLNSRFDYFIDEDLHVYAGLMGGHYAMKGGEYGVAAGELWFDENGKIVFMTNRTGHYGCSEAQMQLSIRFFKDRGFMADDALCAPHMATPLVSPNEWLASYSKEASADGAAPVISHADHPLVSEVARLKSLPIHFPEIEGSAKSIGRRFIELNDLHRNAKTTPIDHTKLDENDLKILEIIEHNALEDAMKNGMTAMFNSRGWVHASLIGVPNHQAVAQKEWERLKANRPHPELYHLLFDTRA